MGAAAVPLKRPLVKAVDACTFRAVAIAAPGDIAMPLNAAERILILSLVAFCIAAFVAVAATEYTA